MTREAQDKRFTELLNQIKEIRAKKNADYATEGDSLSNLKMSEMMGIPAWKGALIRIMDKFSRIIQLAKRDGQANVKDESILDTLLDLSIYCLLTIILFEEWLKEQHE